MVDADVPDNFRFESGSRTLPVAGTDASASIEFRCLAGPAALENYRQFCASAEYAPPQNPWWIESWARNRNQDIVVVVGSLQRPVLALALEIVDSGRFRIARFPGGSHANGNFVATVPGVSADAFRTFRSAIGGALKIARPDVDLVLLERQLPSFQGMDNPLCASQSWASPTPSLAIDLSGGLDAVLERTSGKRKRKKHRAQTRKFEAAGGLRRFQAADRAETDRLLETFFEMKAARFAASGIPDVFADAGIRGFFRDLFGEAVVQPKPEFVLQALEVGGKLRAVTGCSVTKSSIICEFGSIADDELASTSPGDFLFFENIREACEAGLDTYDFSVGDEPYKRLWCDMETRHFDTAIAVSMKGRLAVAGLKAMNSAKRVVKSSPLARTFIRRLRRRASLPASA